MHTPPLVEASPTTKTNTFPSQLGFWSLHCGLTALPSFCIALTTFNSGLAILAMLCGIATFVLGYTLITSSSLYGKIHAGLIGRSIKLGARIRMIISLASLPLLIPLIGTNINDSPEPPTGLFFAPDFWFGYAAIVIVVMIMGAISSPSASFLGSDGDLGGNFLTTYAVTIVEGLLISISLITIAFITLIILNFRKNRRQFPSQHFTAP